MGPDQPGVNHPQYSVTLFNRQRTASELFPDVSKIKGDRETADIKQISNTDWDFVIDISCYYPEALRLALSQISPSTKNYIFISSCSAYDNTNYKEPMKCEETPLLECSKLQRVDRTPGSYGNRKAECERILIASGINHTILRPALVYGRYDSTDRFYYWLYQVQKNSTLLLPNSGKSKFSTTYVKDLVQAILTSISCDVKNTAFNVITTPETSIKLITDTASRLLDKNPILQNADSEFLKSHEVSEWTDMPLWIDGDFFTYSNQRACAHLSLMPTKFKSSVQETVHHFESKNWPTPEYGMDEKRKADLLKRINC